MAFVIPEYYVLLRDTMIVDPEEVHQMHNVGDVVAEYIVFGICAQKGGRTVVVG